MRRRSDVAIVGAGTAGAAAAAFCAMRGLSVVCIDRKPLAEAGARWVNDVPGWCFDEAGIARPTGAEVIAEGGDFHLVAGWGPMRVVVRGCDAVVADMRLLVARLQRMAVEAGATLKGGVRVERLRAGALETSEGILEAGVIVDASGLAGARLLEQTAPRGSICAAAQEVREVRDVAAARAFFGAHGVRAGDTLCFTAIAGGYSIVNVRLLSNPARLSILTGSIPADGHASGVDLLNDFVAAHAWVGPRIFGGARAIPLGHPCDRVASGKVALLGDAALQVFSAHGSGIGTGLVAARMLADAVAEGRGIDGYATAWHRRFGGLHAGYDLFRRFTQSVGVKDLERMIASGLLNEASVRAGLEQRWPSLAPRDVLPMALGALREPMVAWKLAPVLARMPLLSLHYARYPRDARRLPAWARTRLRVSPEDR